MVECPSCGRGFEVPVPRSPEDESEDSDEPFQVVIDLSGKNKDQVLFTEQSVTYRKKEIPYEEIEGFMVHSNTTTTLGARGSGSYGCMVRSVKDKFFFNKTYMSKFDMHEDNFGKLAACFSEFVVPKVGKKLFYKVFDEGQELKFDPLMVNKEGVSKNQFLFWCKKTIPWAEYEDRKSVV